MDYIQLIKKLLIEDKEKLYHMNKNKTAISLVKILESEINNFDYFDNLEQTYLLDIFDILIELIKNSKTLQREFYDSFTFIHNKIRNLLHAKPQEENKKIEVKFRLLLNIINKMENTMLTLYYDNPIEYDPNKEEFIYYITFKLKYINIFNNAYEKFPHIVNSVDKDGIPLAEKVLIKYLEALDLYLSKENLGPIDDLIYYGKVLKTLFDSEKIKIDEYNKKLMIDKVMDFYQSKNFTSNRHKEKLSFFINDILNIINKEREDNTLSYLSYKYEVHDKFKEAHILEAKRISNKFLDIGNITTPRKIFTFDGSGAKEIDDGLSITYEDGIYHLGVHIADPTSYISEYSILFDEATRRTTSLYMEDYCISLYPILLSGNTMSLNEGKNTYCMSFYFDIDAKTGSLLNFDIKNEICRIAKNLTYDYFNQCLDKGTDDKELFDTLIHLTNISDILKKTYKEEAIYKEIHNDKNKTLATSVVESAMIYTNYNVAKVFSERDLPFIYRCHNINQEEIERLAEIQKSLREKSKTTELIHSIEYMKNMYPRAFYSRKNTGHYGLGIDYYSHTTSPLRRLADNIAMMCIKTFIINNDQKQDLKEEIKKMNELIDEIAETINSKRNSVEDYQIQYLRLVKK